MTSPVDEEVVVENLESPMQDCLDKKCPTEAAACKKDVTGCLGPALKCDSKCGNDVQCLRTCAAASGNQNLKNLAACGEKNCANLRLKKAIVTVLK